MDVRQGTPDPGADAGHVLTQRLFAVAEAAMARRAHLERALRSRVVVEQAKGILAERFQLTMDDAFDLLRAAARRSRRRLQDLATAVVASPTTPPEVAAELARRAERD